MKTHTSRLLSALLVLCMVLSLLPTAALADDSDFTIEYGLLNEYALLTKYNGSGGDVTIPSGVTAIGMSAFQDCSNLTSVTIPDGVTTIGETAFSGCSSLTSVTIPGSVASIGGYAFDETPWLDSLGEIAVSNGILLAYRGNGGAVVIPNTVTTIGAYAFSDCGNLTSVTIPDGVTSIGEGAFLDCGNLTGVTIPDSVTTIGAYAFYGCGNLTSVTIPNGVTTIGETAFAYCGMTSVTIPGSVTTMGNFAFSPCSSLTSVTISDGAAIGEAAFSNCSSLTSVTIPNRVASIGAYAFDETPWLDSLGEFAVGNGILFAYRGNGGAVVIPNTVTTIGACAFYMCGNLTSVTIPDGVTTIGEAAFQKCDNLTSVTIPGSVTSIGEGAFFETPWLGSLGEFAVVNGILLIYQGDGGEIVIPNSVTAIGDRAFIYSNNLTSVTIPDGVTTIGRAAFEDCRMTSVTIPDSVTSIGGGAFYLCFSLTDVYYGGSESQWNQINIDPTPGPLSSYGNGNAWLLKAAFHYNAGSNTPDTPKAVLSPQKLKVNGDDKVCEKYNINDENYFKLRDLAYMLGGTGSQFSVAYDYETQLISIKTGQPYTPIGTELDDIADRSETAVNSFQEIFIDDEQVSLKAYNIGGYNFFRLRDLGPILGFEVDFDWDTNTAIVNSK